MCCDVFELVRARFTTKCQCTETQDQWSVPVMTIRSVAAGLSGVALMLSLSCLSSRPFAQTRADNEPQQVFNNACRTCHTIKEGDNRLGPNLFKVIGRPAGSLPNYNYSSAMK